jgi:hypothetical protein
MRALRIAPMLQGIYFIGTGVWPILHLRSFEAVTGPKFDGWLVKTFGALVASVGAALVVGSREGRGASHVLPTLGIGSAAALGLADGIYVLKGRISPVYLLDLLAEVALAGVWLCEARRASPRSRAPHAPGASMD